MDLCADCHRRHVRRLGSKTPRCYQCLRLHDAALRTARRREQWAQTLDGSDVPQTPPERRPGEPNPAGVANRITDVAEETVGVDGALWRITIRRVV